MPAQESVRAYWPLITLGGLTVFAPLIEGGTTHLPVLIIRLILLGAVIVWLLRSMRTGWIAIQQTHVFSAMEAFVGCAGVAGVRSSHLAATLQSLVSITS